MCAGLPWGCFYDSLPGFGSPKQTRQTKMDSAFIDKFQAAEIREPLR